MKVFLSSHLRGYTHEHNPVEANGATLAEAMNDLDRQFPGIRFRIINEQDQVREHIKIFVNQDQQRDLVTPVAQKDEIHIIGALSGG